jgi:hypothetical protein
MVTNRCLFLTFQLCPENAEDFVEYLLNVGHLDEAAVRLAQLVNNENFNSRKVSVIFERFVLSWV